MSKKSLISCPIAFAAAVVLTLGIAPLQVDAAEAAVSAWDTAEFRIWGFVPDWTPQSQVNGFSSSGVFDHVSDVIYFGGVRPTATGDLVTTSAGAGHLRSLKSQAASEDFRLHMSMFTVSGGSVESVWNSVTGSSTNRANFVSNVADLLDEYDMAGFNFDWERPDTVTEWANYTQTAIDLRQAIGPEREISVDDYGFASTLWDNTPVFDARTYDQLFIMGYHFPADDGTSLDYQTFAATKRNLTGQGTEKAFVNEQLVPGIGTWGDNGPATVSLQAIVNANPNLPADATSFTGTVRDLNGNLRTGTWDIESRYMVRDKVQFAIDNNMPGVMSWTLHYDAVGPMSLHRVAHHYAMWSLDMPDLNLDGVIDAADADTLANHMGSVPGWTGTNTNARFENFYQAGNWEQGDRDGNGFVNQADADWLADRFAVLDVELPDRLAYTGEFEQFGDSQGLTGRWQAAREASGALSETGNFTQHATGELAFSASGPGSGLHSSSAITIRNQNDAEQFDSLNTAPRSLAATLAEPVDLAAPAEQYFTLLVRENTGPLLSEHVTSSNRQLSIRLLDDEGDAPLEILLNGFAGQAILLAHDDQGTQFGSTGGFASDTSMMVIGKLSASTENGSQLQLSLVPNGGVVENFTAPDYPWQAAVTGTWADQPMLSSIELESLFAGNFTVSNLWLGSAVDFFQPMPGDFNGDGTVDASDYAVWRNNFGTTVNAYTLGDANGDTLVDIADWQIWKQNYGQQAAQLAAAQTVPEPSSIALLVLFGVAAAARARR